uniref:Putative secreted protein n=1 Tax=Anopheles triannulatus TaxID=58253 RepID=A0A2M4B776_9DIPT
MSVCFTVMISEITLHSAFAWFETVDEIVVLPIVCAIPPSSSSNFYQTDAFDTSTVANTSVSSNNGSFSKELN